MQRPSTLIAISAVFITFALTSIGRREAQAVPMFARKLGVSCSTCHTTAPRLNETGYRFRAAGFRLPEMISEEDQRRFEITDYFSARAQVRYDASRTKTDSETRTRDQLKLQALELYPFTGAWGKQLSSNIKIAFAPGKSPEIENAYAKFNAGNEKKFFGVRAGIFHPFDGYGAADSPATISRPFFQTTPANFNQSTFFTTWGFDQLGAEVGFDYRRTSVRVTLLNGLTLSKEGSKFNATAAQGGPLTKPSAAPAHHTSDFQVFVNHVLHPEGGGVSLHYYQGRLPLPITDTENFFLNKFDRLAVYGSYPVASRLHLLSGLQRGRDRAATGEKFSSLGAFIEAVVPLHELSAAGIRYDWFDPARNKPDNELTGITTFVNVWFYEQFRIVGEYQHKNTKRGPAPEQEDDIFQVRFIYIK